MNSKKPNFTSMFTGIIEATGTIRGISSNGTNKTFTITCPFVSELKVDQSLSHDGVCLTVESIDADSYTVTAIEETLRKTHLDQWKQGGLVNLERCMLMNGRLDGHIVQGHVDTTGRCIAVEDQQGSWLYTFGIPPSFAPLLIEKGSVAINGISLTVFNVTDSSFSVAIIPYTFEHTNIRMVKAGSAVNLEFDMIGKYINRRLQLLSLSNAV